ncbi:MAG: hypothetical protein ABR591_15770, partial [Candidatus Velthaea sp.]
MSAEVARVALRLRCTRVQEARARALARDVRSALGPALAAAIGQRPHAGTTVVPRMHVTLRAHLRRIGAPAIARAIADACVEAAAARSEA